MFQATDIASTLSDPNFAGTVFAPTDTAFSTLLAQLNITAADLLANIPLLTQAEPVSRHDPCLTDQHTQLLSQDSPVVDWINCLVDFQCGVSLCRCWTTMWFPMPPTSPAA